MEFNLREDWKHGKCWWQKDFLRFHFASSKLKNTVLSYVTQYNTIHTISTNIGVQSKFQSLQAPNAPNYWNTPFEFPPINDFAQRPVLRPIQNVESSFSKRGKNSGSTEDDEVDVENQEDERNSPFINVVDQTHALPLTLLKCPILLSFADISNHFSELGELILFASNTDKHFIEFDERQKTRGFAHTKPKIARYAKFTEIFAKIIEKFYAFQVDFKNSPIEECVEEYSHKFTNILIPGLLIMEKYCLNFMQMPRWWS
ncbi:unnamed protein product [Caenorhabditis brenneri]